MERLMSAGMKILIGYDGSECANAAVEDLKNAGLPKTVAALVISVADVFIPPANDDEIDNSLPMNVRAGVTRARDYAEGKLNAAETMAAQASEEIESMFPEWQVSHQTLA